MEPAEIENIRAVWDLVLPDKKHHGVELFIRLFDQFPETKEKFPRLSSSYNSPEAMRKSPRLGAHAGRVVTALSSIIEAIDDTELLDENIYFLGDGHNKRKVSNEDFRKFGVIFLDYLQVTLPSDAYPPAASDAFKKLIDSFNLKMSEYLEQ